MRAWLAAGVLLACASVAGATDLNTEVAELKSALQARIDAGAGGKELKQFNKVVKKLDKTPDVTVKDMKKVLGGVSKSGTADATVLKEARDVLDCLCLEVQAQEALVLVISGTIPNSAFQDKVQRKVDKARAKLDFAKTFIEENPAKATKLLVGAYAKYLGAGRTADKLFVKAQPKPPPRGFSIAGQFISNDSGKPQNLKQVTISVEFLDEGGGSLGKVNGKGTALLPDLFQNFNNRIFPGFYDWGQFVTELFVQNTPPQGTTHFRGQVTFQLGKFAPFGTTLNDVPIGNFWFQ